MLTSKYSHGDKWRVVKSQARAETLWPQGTMSQCTLPASSPTHLPYYSPLSVSQYSTHIMSLNICQGHPCGLDYSSPDLAPFKTLLILLGGVPNSLFP